MSVAIEIKERPILFSAPMVRAILDGRKTQTRRVLNPQPTENEFEPQLLHFMRGLKSFTFDKSNPQRACPFGAPGDRLWVRENWHPDPPVNGKWDYYGFTDGELYNFDQLPKKYKKPKHVIYQASWNGSPLKWCPSIHMFRWASRITLEVTAVRVERLKDISEEDAKAEGADNNHARIFTAFKSSIANVYRRNFGLLWNSLNESRGFGWDANPWVWVVEFKRVAEALD